MAVEIVELTDWQAPHLSGLLIAPGKFGKTTAGSTLPRPLLVGDADGGIGSLLKKNLIDPKGIYVAPIRTYEDGKDFVENAWRKGPGGKPFASIFFDSYTWFMGNIVKAEILQMTKREKMERNDWGLYLERGLYIMQRAHKLARAEDGCHVVLACHESDKSDDDGGVGKLGPAVSGQLFDILPGMPDFVIFLRIRPTGKFDPVTKRPIAKRVFQLAADVKTPAGARAEVPDEMEPDFTKLWGIVQKTPQIGGV